TINLSAVLVSFILGERNFAPFTFGITFFHFLQNFNTRLSHSHVPLRYGRLLESIFVSPTIHQVHHSKERLDKNFGSTLSLFDWLFGTLYRPSPDEQMNWGIPEGSKEIDSLLNFFIHPFKKSYKIIRASIYRLAQKNA